MLHLKDDVVTVQMEEIAKLIYQWTNVKNCYTENCWNTIPNVTGFSLYVFFFFLYTFLFLFFSNIAAQNDTTQTFVTHDTDG